MNKTDEQTAVFAGVLLAIGLPIMIFLLTLWGAFWSALAGWQLWQWFAIPLGAPNINGYHIAGLLMLAHLGLPGAKNDDKEKDKTVKLIASIVQMPMISLFVVIAGFITAKLAGLI